MPNLPDPTNAAETAARATHATIGPDLDVQSIGHWASKNAHAWLASQGVTRAQFDAASDQDPISSAYTRYVNAFRNAYLALN